MIDPYFCPERRSSKTGSTQVEGVFGDVSFSLTGPPETVNSIVTYIRNLVKFTLKR
jgi:hypothetical protein